MRTSWAEHRQRPRVRRQPTLALDATELKAKQARFLATSTRSQEGRRRRRSRCATGWRRVARSPEGHGTGSRCWSATVSITSGDKGNPPGRADGEGAHDRHVALAVRTRCSDCSPLRDHEARRQAKQVVKSDSWCSTTCSRRDHGRKAVAQGRGAHKAPLPTDASMGAGEKRGSTQRNRGGADGDSDVELGSE